MNAAHLAQLFDSFTRHDEWYDDRGPAHDDHQPSLSLRDGDGRVGVSHAGCSRGEIVSALDLAPSDLSFKVASVSSYRNLEHSLFFPVVRDPAESRLRRPDGDWSWIWNLEGAENVAYCLPELAVAVAENKPWAFIVEGENDVDRWCGLGLLATTGYGFSASFFARNSRIHIRSVALAEAHA